jgi:LacI family transcriptional regulator
MGNSPTMNDVAREAGVALRTVSRYVNGATNIDSELAERIRLAIDTLGYRRNLAAASIRPGWDSKVLGLIIGDLSNPYYTALTRAIEREASDRGYLLITASSEEDGTRHDRLVDRLVEQRVDGLIIVPPHRPARLWSEVAGTLPPIVFLDRPVAGMAADAVLSDDLGGARAAVTSLIDAGTRSVAFVGESLSIYTLEQRMLGYEQALREQGIESRHELVFTEAHTEAQARVAVARMLTETDVDAVFGANNRATIGALWAFRDTGRRLPLIGFDDFDLAQLMQPEVSVVSQDVEQMGTLAASLLIDRLSGTGAPTGEHVLPTTLLLRGSEQGFD